MKYTCAADTCTQSELYDLLQEMDRRYYLLQDLRWEFSLLDREQKDIITEDQARYCWIRELLWRLFLLIHSPSIWFCNIKFVI